MSDEEIKELKKEILKLTKDFKKLSKETKDEIAKLNKRIKELIESKISISSVPDYWFEEFSVEQKEENSNSIS